MPNRNKLIELFISNLSNAVIHKVLEKAIDASEISVKYNKEIRNSWDIAKRYREKINPANKSLADNDINEIKRKITNEVKAELKTRMERGYENININLVEEFVDKSLKELKVE